MENTCYLLIACFLGALAIASAGNQPGSAVPETILTVDVKQDGSFVKAETASIRMYMTTITTKEFRIAVLCDYSKNEICVDIESTDINVLSMVGEANVCFECKNGTDSVAELRNDASETLLKDTNETDTDRAGLENGTQVEKLLNITVQSSLIGAADLEFKITNFTQDSITSQAGYVYNSVNIEYRVVRSPSPLDLVFVICVYILEIMEMFIFGTQLDFATVKKTFRRPQLPLIGFVCQYVGMPLIAFSIAKANSDLSGDASASLASLGIFVAGICPGGGGSNIYTYLLGGDLSLSITMTTISTVMSLGMMPLWLYTLGQEFLDSETAQLPYTDILVTLSIILVPLALGLLIQNKVPRVATLVEKILTVVISIIALVLIVTGVYANLYIFQLMSLKVVLIGCALPYVGFFLGGTVAMLIGLPENVVKTIAIETGMQNTGVGFLLLFNSLEEPYGDIASVAPVSSEIISPIPPMITAIVYIVHKKYCSKYKSVPGTSTDALKGTPSGEYKTALPIDDNESDHEIPCNGNEKFNDINRVKNENARVSNGIV